MQARRKPFTPESLAADFGRAAPLAQRAIDCLGVQRYYEILLRALAGEEPEACPTAREIAAALQTYASSGGGQDFLKPLYYDLFPRELRHGLGEYYTPDWLVEHVLDQLGYDGNPERRILDPACGSGAFLLGAIRRLRRWHEAHPPIDEGEFRRRILASVIGCDINPLAVLAAKANYRLATGAGAEDIPVHLRDTILNPPACRVHYVAGNPPWIAWDNLSPEYRARTRPLWERYGLFSLSAAAARHGGAKKDLASLMLYACADHFLERGGKLGFVITQTLFQTRGAGDGFRRFPGLRVRRVDDLSGFQPFDGASNWTAVIVLEKGPETAYPVPYFQWRDRQTATECEARPIGRPGSPWMVRAKGAPAIHTSAADYVAHLGANTGGANGVYWLDILERSAAGVLVRNLAAAG
ncbi:MAG: N-6 DNA methylase, partial [Acidobacteria bacterium]|nr:N-6 DNA methylase [Acidobacteriota bacterium]